MDYNQSVLLLLLLLLRKNSQNLCKSLQSTLENSSIQTAEPIVKFHTIFEMGSHDGSSHTFGSSLQFLEVPQKGILKNIFLVLFGTKVISNFYRQTSTIVANHRHTWSQLGGGGMGGVVSDHCQQYKQMNTNVTHEAHALPQCSRLSHATLSRLYDYEDDF